MNAWAMLWGVVLIVVLCVFAILAIVVAIGGYHDVKMLFASIEAQHEEADKEAEEQ